MNSQNLRSIIASRLSLLAVCVAAVGCHSDHRVTAHHASTCPGGSCQKSVVIQFSNECRDKLWDHGKWAEGVPQEVIDACGTPYGTCTIPVWSGTYSTPDCECTSHSRFFSTKDEFLEALVQLDADKCDLLDGCCGSPSVDSLSESDQLAADEAGQDMIDTMQDFDCTAGAASNCNNDDAWSCDMVYECSPLAGARTGCAREAAPGMCEQSRSSAVARQRLVIAPAQSRASLTQPLGTSDAEVSGAISLGGSASTTLDAELTLGDVVVNGLQARNWIFQLTGAVEVDAATGNFSLAASGENELRGSGYVDGELVNVRLTPGNAIRGRIDAASGTWTLDYSETAGLVELSVHLQGTVD